MDEIADQAPPSDPGNAEAGAGETARVQQRGQWANRTEFVLSMTGMIIGVGNLWRFPYLCFKNGGGAFFVPYFILLIFVGLPVFFLETAIGQYTSEGGVTAWRKMCPMFEGIGIASQVLVLYVNIYFITVLSWGFYYLFNSFRNPLPWTTCDNIWNTGLCKNMSIGDNSFLYNFTEDNYYENERDLHFESPEREFWEHRALGRTESLTEGLGLVRWDLALCLLLAWVICYFCIFMGVKSTGKVVYLTATVPFLLLFVLFVRGVSLPGSWDGIVYYLYPDFSKIGRPQVWFDAATQVLYSYSMSQGVLTALGSYNKYNNDCYKDCIALCVLSSVTSIFAGLAVFSIMGFTAHALGVSIPEVTSSGIGLAFISFPKALALLPGAQFWSVLFFLMVLFLSVDSQFLCVDSLCTAISDMFPGVLRGPGRRELLSLGVVVFCFLLGLPLVTNGGAHVFQLMDNYGANAVCMLFIVCFETLVIGWVYGADRFYDNIEDMIGYKPYPVIKYCWLFVTPIICVFMLSYSITEVQNYTEEWLVLGLGSLMMLLSMMCIPAYILVRLCKSNGTDITAASADLRQARPHKPRLTLCRRVIFPGRTASHREAEEEKLVGEHTSRF
ncbi:hypothetical protein COCON_G00230520 [Conger conger]|uniref:Transporter n=1 Tax=Conger conger TaxID=82655 RepID=A0A9Q1CVE7_CONCO|nr:hypothetical protein COCON_G00230520 [Conger conger]